jgi:osmotically-inducible protein OsmY
MNENPFNYSISSDIVLSLLNHKLECHPMLKGEKISICLIGNDCVLKGTVDSLEKKWLAEDIVADAPGVLQIKNEINVINKPEQSAENFYEI